MLNKIKRLLNTYTMYFLIRIGLLLLAAYAVILSLLGLLSFSALALIVSFFVLATTCYFSNLLFARVAGAFPSTESSVITASILFFLLQPSLSVGGIGTLVIAGVLAMASKYVFALRRRHIFNPAAIAAVILGAFGSGAVIWWVANPFLLPGSLLLSAALIYKVRRWNMAGVFLAAALVSASVFVTVTGGTLLSLFPSFFFSWPVLFFAGIMLTEPATAPARAGEQIAYGALVGLLFSAQYHVGVFYSTPELALVIGNAFAFFTKPSAMRRLTLVSSAPVANGMREFLFRPDRPLAFQAGQYAEWTLPHAKPDARGNRRYFTLASSPNEETIRLAVRLPESGASTFKQALSAMKPGDRLALAQLAGDFMLPEDVSQKLVWIAGGIGVTPFRSMAQVLMDRQEKRDIILLYAAMRPDAFAYLDLFEHAASIGLRTVPMLSDAKPGDIPASWTGKTGRLTPELVKELVPDFLERAFYLSGPSAMVDGYKALLLTLGVSSNNIHTDYFPGF